MLADNLIHSPSVQLGLPDVEVVREVNATTTKGKDHAEFSGAGISLVLIG